MRSKLLIGLGNPGEKYDRTRHNLGKHVLRAWVEQVKNSSLAHQPWAASRFDADLAQLTFAATKITCLLPRTYMNNSGRAVRSYLQRNFRWLWRSFDPQSILITHDDLELPLGTVRLKSSGSARGHNGIKSIQKSLDTQNIPRLLLGIGPKPISAIHDFVLGKFTPAEEKIIFEQTLPQASAILNKFISADF